MPKSFASFSLAFILMAQGGIICAAEESNVGQEAGYPAPPGAYGQDKLLNNAHFNLGKGSPYILLESPENPLKDENQQQTSIPENRVPRNYPAVETADTDDNNSSLTDLPVFQPSQITTQMTGNTPQEQQDNYFYYPEAEEMRKQYQQAGHLSFEQWGQETSEDGDYGFATEYGDPVVPINTSPNWQSYPEKQPSRLHQSYISRDRITAAPNVNAIDYQHFPVQTKADQYYPGYMMDQFFGNPNNRDWMAPSNPYLKPFDQFPVPQNPYGFSSATSSMNRPGIPAGKNLQYLPAIPEEEIIYPPSYPGKRPRN